MELKLLVDNTAAQGLLVEHGFALWLDTGDQVILLDSGQGEALVHNAEKLGCDLSRVNSLVLSHGHYDHTGGVADLLAINPDVQIFCHPGVFNHRYSLHPGKPPRFIGMQKGVAESIHALPSKQLQVNSKPQQLTKGVGITGQIPRLHPLEDTGGPFYFDTEGEQVDPIADDQAVWVETSKGLVVLLGCCHSGLINTLRHVQYVSGVSRIRGVIGGLHLLFATEQRLQQTAEALEELDLEFVVPCHCTGSEAMSYLADSLSANVAVGEAGMGWRV